MPPQDILHAMQAQITAEREKRARIAQSEGVKVEQINLATGAREAAIQKSQGEMQATINNSEGGKQAAINQAMGEAGRSGWWRTPPPTRSTASPAPSAPKAAWRRST